jgi:hypothetical protein
LCFPLHELPADSGKDTGAHFTQPQGGFIDNATVENNLLPTALLPLQLPGWADQQLK